MVDYIIGEASKNFIGGVTTVDPRDFSNSSLLDPLHTITIQLFTFNEYMVTFSGQQVFVVMGEEISIGSPDGETIDRYVFYSHDGKSIDVTIKRPKRISFNKDITPNVVSINNNINSTNKIEVPILYIWGQTLIDGSDIGNVIFTIKDEFQYYGKNDIPSELNKCDTYNIDSSDLKITTFQKDCPKIVSVVIGNGETWYDKTEYLFKTLGKEKIRSDFGDFRSKMFLYAMLKFILSRILYNRFNVKFLLRKYNKKFLKDLAKSRFCEALQLFLDTKSIIFGYDKYFKFDL